MANLQTAENYSQALKPTQRTMARLYEAAF